LVRELLVGSGGTRDGACLMGRLVSRYSPGEILAHLHARYVVEGGLSSDQLRLWRL